MNINIKFWVGTYYEKTLVFDPTMQISTPDFVLLWDLGDEKMYRYAINFARRRLRPIKEAHAFQLTVKKYLEWLVSHSESTTDLKNLMWKEAPFYGVPKEFLSEITLKGRHEIIITGLGFAYKGTRPSDKGKPRTAHCWMCHSALDNSIDIECVACSWILCDCGACGCGYSRARP